ncbi:MAG TPA: FmdB family zinc ribbon protein [Candidatus Limnocylindria bacterium]
MVLPPPRPPRRRGESGGRASGLDRPRPDPDPAAGGRVAATRSRCHDLGSVPTYDYQCRSCGAVTEVIHAMTEDGPSVCEICGGALRRVLYPAGIIFKGSGFYRTDSRAAGSSPSAGASSPAPTSKADAAVTDAKPVANGGSDGAKAPRASGDASS